MLLTVVFCALVCGAGASSIQSRLQRRQTELVERITAEQGGTPLIVPNWGPYDVAEGGCAQWHVVLFLPFFFSLSVIVF